MKILKVSFRKITLFVLLHYNSIVLLSFYYFIPITNAETSILPAFLDKSTTTNSHSKSSTNIFNSVFSNKYHHMTKRSDADFSVIYDGSSKSRSYNGKFVIESEAGSLQVDDDSTNQQNSDSPSSSSQFQYGEDEQYFRTQYVATTPKIEDVPKSNSEYEDIYEDDSNDETRKEAPPQNAVSFLDTAKNMWDIFNALNTAWKRVEEHHKNQGEKIMQQDRSDRNLHIAEETSVTQIPGEEIVEIETRNPQPLNEMSTEVAAVEEGRYIKGDPLKGYYDFVITEGSYKFWAAFQLATAILIIYSTFAAIYYSKVNPLVGDYDYIDYLGGGRSLSDDADFEDTADDQNPYSHSKPGGDTAEETVTASPSSSSTVTTKTTTATKTGKVDKTSSNSLWSSLVYGEWLPRAGHAFEFILEAIDKIPQ